MSCRRFSESPEEELLDPSGGGMYPTWLDMDPWGGTACIMLMVRGSRVNQDECSSVNSYCLYSSSWVMMRVTSVLKSCMMMTVTVMITCACVWLGIKLVNRMTIVLLSLLKLSCSRLLLLWISRASHDDCKHCLCLLPSNQKWRWRWWQTRRWDDGQRRMDDEDDEGGDDDRRQISVVSDEVVRIVSLVEEMRDSLTGERERETNRARQCFSCFPPSETVQ